MSGSRVPKNYREVQKLADGMMLLPEQQGELLDAYYRNLYGDKTYEGYRKIAETLEGIDVYKRQAPVGLSKRGRDTESDANIQPEEMLTFFSNEYSICIST